jgi:hypothetical protein
VAIVLLCLIPDINRRVVLANRIALAGSAVLLAACRAGTGFLAVETGKARASNGLSRNGAGGALESSCRPREAENPISIFAKAVHYV